MNTMHVHIEAFYRHWLVLGLDCKYISGGLKIVKSTNRIVISAHSESITLDTSQVKFRFTKKTKFIP